MAGVEALRNVAGLIRAAREREIAALVRERDALRAMLNEAERNTQATLVAVAQARLAALLEGEES